jgi:hypothetical protein
MEEAQLAKQILDHAKDGNWRMATAAALTAAVWFLRTIAIRPGLEGLPTVGPLFKWMKTDRGGVFLALFVGVLGGVGTSLAAHQAITPSLLLDGVVNGVFGAGVYSTFRKFASPSDAPGPAIAQPDGPVTPPPAEPPSTPTAGSTR